MCGIAGYSVSQRSTIDRTLAAQALLAGIAERGEDAVGYAYRLPATGLPSVRKQQTGPSALLDDLCLPPAAAQLLIHVRDFTKGHPSIAANNHPVRHGAVVGVHNGIIENDDELFARHGWARDDAEMTVDSEIIFAVAEASESAPAALEQLRGAMAAAWMDERDAATVFVARGVGRPLWLGVGRHEVLFASTRFTLDLTASTLGLRLRLRELPEGRQLRLVDGAVASVARWSPDRSYVENDLLPAVRAPREGEQCLRRLAAITAFA